VQEQGVDLTSILKHTHNLNSQAQEEEAEDTSHAKSPRSHSDHGSTVAAAAASTLSVPGGGGSGGVVAAHPGVPASPAPHSSLPLSSSQTALALTEAEAAAAAQALATEAATARGGEAAATADAATAAAATSSSSAAEPAAALLQTSEEGLQLGRMGKEVYLAYFRAGSSVLGYVAVLLVVLASQAASLGSDYFLASWSTTVTKAVQQAQQANAANAAAAAAAATGLQLHAAGDSLLHTLVPSQVLDFGAEPLRSVSEVMLAMNTSTAAQNSSIAAELSYQHFLPHPQSHYITIYALLVFASASLLFLRSVYIALTTVRAASTLHASLFQGVVRAPQHFFDSTPSGRILSRASKDTEQVDAVLPGCVQDILANGVVVLGTLVLIVVVAPLSIIGLLLIGALYWYVQHYYHPTSRQLKRLESVSRSPIYQRLNETAAGLATIRAFSHTGSLGRAISAMYSRIDVNTRCMFYSFSLHRWLGVRLEGIGASIVFLASTLVILLQESLGVGLVGLAISTTLGLAGNLNWSVRTISEIENQLNSVERIMEYAKIEPEETFGQSTQAEAGAEDGAAAQQHALDAQALLTAEEKEADAEWSSFDPTFASILCGCKTNKQKVQQQSQSETPQRKKSRTERNYVSLPADGAESLLSSVDGDVELGAAHVSSSTSAGLGQPPAGWPSAGAISFSDVSISYRPDPAFPNVLSNVTAHIRAGEKIGIVGRTGAVSSTRTRQTRRGDVWLCASAHLRVCNV